MLQMACDGPKTLVTYVQNAVSIFSLMKCHSEFLYSDLIIMVYKCETHSLEIV